jgi:CheY-like chemotaxis protein
MPDGGTIEVRTWTTALDAAIRERHPEAPDVEYAVLEVTDRGPRLAADALDQLFEPFFTARELGRSAGLGLASVYGITKQQGGLLDCRPGPLGGTTIRVLLPLAEEAESPRSKTPPSENPLPGAATVLVVDDEAQVRSVVRRILERAGHRVIGAADGYDALRQFETYRDEIDVAVLDVVMPGMSGPELLQRLRRTAPGLPALFITGESFGLDAAEGTGPDAEVLKKPFPPHRLLEEVTAALKYRSAANG